VPRHTGEYEPERFRKSEWLLDNAEFYDFMSRILRSEYNFYMSNRSTELLETKIRDSKKSISPDSLYHRLKKAGILIQKVMHFTTPFKGMHGQKPGIPLPCRPYRKQTEFSTDLARFLKEMQGNTRKVQWRSFSVPPSQEEGGKGNIEWIEKGIMKVDCDTLVFDTTLNEGLMQLLKEIDQRPGIIIKQFTFWRDNDDIKSKPMAEVFWR